jgi:hypothetical protein
VYDKDYLLDAVKMKRSMLKNPFEKFERKRFIYYGKDVKLLQINPSLWDDLSKSDIKEIQRITFDNLETYYKDFGGLNG